MLLIELLIHYTFHKKNMGIQKRLQNGIQKGIHNTEEDERKITQTKYPYSLCFIKFINLSIIYLKLILWFYGLGSVI